VLTRRLLTRLAQATSVLALVAAVGCGDDPRADAGPGAAGSGGAGGSGGSGASADCGSAGAGDWSGTGATGGSVGGTGGSIGGTGGSIGGTGGSVGGRGGSVGGTSGTGTSGSGAAGAGGSIGGTVVAGAAGQGGSVALTPWPTSDTVVIVDTANEFGQNVSDLVYEQRAPALGDVLWAVQNSPSTIYCLLWNGTNWASTTDDGWGSGKTIRFPGGTGHPDSEGLTRDDWSSTAIYVSTERDNDYNTVSRKSVLRYDFSVTGTTELVATNEWNLTSDLPTSGANIGLEGIAWIPDAFLVANRFVDESVNATYDPARYPNHGTGLFFVGQESDGVIYGYALDHSAGTFQRVATIASGHPAIMSLYFDRDVGNLWVYCDNTCANQASVLRISSGHFVVQFVYDHPATLPNSNFEGIAFQPESECMQGKKSFFWTDDDDAGGHALYRGTIPCGLLP